MQELLRVKRELKIALIVFLTLVWGMAQAQNRVVTGVIKDGTSGETMPGVNILVKGTSNGTITDANGAFSIQVASDNDVLYLSFVGYKSAEVTVGSQTVLNISMATDVTALQEVVVVGYGEQKKSNVTGAISSVKAKELEDLPVPRLEDALKGRTSGVTVAASSGQPGSSPTVLIRGVTSINNSEPLYVVDGVPILGGIDYLSAADIESIEVLKDAASAAIYGTKAASGVILVTTKKGKAGALRVNVTSYYGSQSPARKLPLLNAQEYATLRNESSLAAGNGIVFANPAALGKGTDWQSTIFNNAAKIMNHELNISGGTEKSTYFASFGYYKQDGIVATSISNYDRFTARLNSTHKINDWLRFGQTLSYAGTKQKANFDANGYYGTPLSSAINLDPVTPVVITDPAILAQAPYVSHLNTLVRDGNGNPYGISPYVGQEMTNPLGYIATHQGSYGWGDKIVANGYLEIEPIQNLKIRSSVGTDLAFWGSESFTPVYFLSSTQSNLTNASFGRGMNKAMNWIWTNTVAYSKTIDAHNFSALIGTEARKMSQFGVNGTYIGVPVKTFGDASMNFNIPVANRQAGGYEAQPYTIASTFARLNYDYNGKYMLTAVIRRDGSSHFGSNYVYGVFPSISLGWIPSLESFWPSNDYVNFLKIRGGYGINGNDNLAAFQYVSTVGGVGSYPFGGQITTGNAPLAPANPNLKWEQTAQLNIAFDAVVMNDFTVTVDAFTKKTTGMLMQVKVPYYSGATNNPWSNVGAMENHGVEVDLGYNKKVGEVGVNIKGNLSYVRNKVTNLGGNDFLTYGTLQSSAYEISRKTVGQAINSFYGFSSKGIFQTQEEVNSYVNSTGALLQPNAKPGDYRWEDVNHDGVINDKDRKFLGDPTPHWMFGFTASATFRNFDLKIFAQGVAGNKIFQGIRRLDIPTANYQTSALGRWTGPGTSSNFPRLIDSDPNGNFSNPSAFYLEDGSYLRIKTVQLGYNFPKSLLSKAKLQNARIYVSGNNLLTLTKYTGYDPEIGGGLFGQDHGIYPQARSIMAGLNITF